MNRSPKCDSYGTTPRTIPPPIIRTRWRIRMGWRRIARILRRAVCGKHSVSRYLGQLKRNSSTCTRSCAICTKARFCAVPNSLLHLTCTRWRTSKSQPWSGLLINCRFKDLWYVTLPPLNLHLLARSAKSRIPGKPHQISGYRMCIRYCSTNPVTGQKNM